MRRFPNVPAKLQVVGLASKVSLSYLDTGSKQEFDNLRLLGRDRSLEDGTFPRVGVYLGLQEGKYHLRILVSALSLEERP